MLKIRRSVLLIASLAAFSLLAGCDNLKSTLSTEQDEEYATDVGTASIAGDTWYYNGDSTTDVSSLSSTLAITFSKEIALSSDGVSGSLVLTYTDANSNTQSVTLSSISGDLVSNKSYAIDMDGVLAYLDGTVTNGTATLAVKLSGFVCAEGSESGRSIPTFSKTISIAPLYTYALANSVNFSTVGYDVSSSYTTIATNGVVSLDTATDFTFTGDSDCPSAFTTDDLQLSISSDGLSIVVGPKSTSDADLTNTTFTGTITINGIRNALLGSDTSYSQTFTLSFMPYLIAIDGIKDSNWSNTKVATYYADATGDGKAGGWAQASDDVAGMYITNDDNYLYIGVKCVDISNTYNDDSIAFYIDTSATTGATTQAGLNDAWCYSSDAMTFTNGQADIVFWNNWGASSGAGSNCFYKNVSGTLTKYADWAATSTSFEYAPRFYHHWISASSAPFEDSDGNVITCPTFIEYRLSLSSMGLSAGDAIKVLGVLSVNWSGTHHAADIFPGSTPSSSTDVTYDFSTAASYTLK